MAKLPRLWKVLPHDPVEKHEDNLWSVRGVMRAGAVLDRRMSIVRLADGRLVFFNAVPLEDAAMADIQRWGKPAFLVVPNGYHRLDIHAFKARYPGMKLLAPAAAAARVGAVAGVDGDLAALPSDPGLRAEAVDGTKIGEPVLVVQSGERVSLIFGDVFFNLAHGGGLGGTLLRLLGSTGGPRVPPIARLILIADRARTRAHLERLAALPGLARLIPSHGRIVDTDAAGVLRAAASTL